MPYLCVYALAVRTSWHKIVYSVQAVVRLVQIVLVSFPLFVICHCDFS